MTKQLQITLILMLVMFLIVSCAPKPAQAPVPAVEEPKVAVPAVPEEVPAPGEESIDEVATDISDTADIDDDLDTSELDDVDSILAEIENI